MAERRRAALVIEKLAKDYVRFFEIEPYLWETEPMLASGTFQDAIVAPGNTDILILILWARLGTPLPKDKYRGIDGTPDLLVYKRKYLRRRSTRPMPTLKNFAVNSGNLTRSSAHYLK